MPLPILVAALCALIYLPITGQAPSLPRSGVKTLSVALLAGAAVQAGGPVLLVVALGLCALGDWFLSRPGEGAFMAGVGAFAAGHVAYVALFLSHPASDLSRLLLWPGLLAALILLALGAAMLRLILPRAGALAGPVAGYVPIILTMGLSALTLPPSGALALVLPAALAFILSDTLLAVEKFLLPQGHQASAPLGFALWILYWLAQAGFLLAFT